MRRRAREAVRIIADLPPITPATVRPCSSCAAHFRIASLDRSADIARHNVECAASGERSYVGYAPYRTLEQSQIARDMSLSKRLEKLRAMGFMIATDGEVIEQ